MPHEDRQQNERSSRNQMQTATKTANEDSQFGGTQLHVHVQPQFQLQLETRNMLKAEIKFK